MSRQPRSLLSELEEHDTARSRANRIGVGVAVMIVVGSLFWTGAYYVVERELPEAAVLKNQYPVIHYSGEDDSPEVRFVREKPSWWVGVDEVSRAAVGAIIVSEDWAFYQHNGYDWRQIREVILESLKEGRLSRGASTITQQVVRNIFLTRERTIWRKLRELVLATRLESQFSKKQILETYLNIAEWGEGAVGIGRASRAYFDKPPSELTPREGAFLAMLLPSPNRYSTSFRERQLTHFARDRIDSILERMEQAGYLTEDELRYAKLQPLSFEESPESNETYPVEPLTESVTSPLGDSSEN